MWVVWMVQVPTLGLWPSIALLIRCARLDLLLRNCDPDPDPDPDPVTDTDPDPEAKLDTARLLLLSSKVCSSASAPCPSHSTAFVNSRAPLELAFCRGRQFSRLELGREQQDTF